MHSVLRSLIFSLSLGASVLLSAAENAPSSSPSAAAANSATSKHALANTVWKNASANSIYTFYADGTFYEEYPGANQRGTWTAVDGTSIKVVLESAAVTFTFTLAADGKSVTRTHDAMAPAVWTRLDNPPKGTTAPKVEKIPDLPWHMVNLWWSFENETENFESFSIDFSINQTVDSEKLNLYVAPIGFGKFNEVGYYGGIQTNSGGWPAAKIEEKQIRRFGKGAIFSRWGKSAMSLDNARAARDGAYESAGYEGDFVSVRRPFPWTAGKYTYSLIKQDYEHNKDGEFTWVGAFVTNHQTNEQHYIGSLRFPGASLKFWNRHSSFVEIYGGKKVTIAELPPIEVRIGMPRINGKPASTKSLSVVFPTDPSTASPAIMTAELDKETDEVVMKLHNRILTEREQWSYKLK